MMKKTAGTKISHRNTVQKQLCDIFKLDTLKNDLTIHKIWS